ncbi:unnamed protein product [marine sediment metagenome]|uniref:Uncharacterized protein n=1 Tax=marine sediment metagenome TaxID=412755 RepID=X1KVW0_9ZZZZ
MLAFVAGKVRIAINQKISNARKKNKKTNKPRDETSYRTFHL